MTYVVITGYLKINSIYFISARNRLSWSGTALNTVWADNNYWPFGLISRVHKSSLSWRVQENQVRRFTWTNKRFDYQMRLSTVCFAILQCTHAQDVTTAQTIESTTDLSNGAIVSIDYFYGQLEINSKKFTN